MTVQLTHGGLAQLQESKCHFGSVEKYRPQEEMLPGWLQKFGRFCRYWEKNGFLNYSLIRRAVTQTQHPPTVVLTVHFTCEGCLKCPLHGWLGSQEICSGGFRQSILKKRQLFKIQFQLVIDIGPLPLFLLPLYMLLMRSPIRYLIVLPTNRSGSGGSTVL